jgi:ribosomal protein L30E
MTKLPAGMASALKNSGKRSSPLWEGPGSDGPNGGITQGLLQKWLVCPERARLYLLEGLAPVDDFNHRLSYGNMWHVCEEALAKGPDPTNKKGIFPWEAPLKGYCTELAKQYPFQQEQIIHWMNVCKVQFPIYVDFWSKHKDVTTRQPILQEVEFKVPYELPSGRAVILRGKWDSVDLVGKGKAKSIILKENKSKGDIDEVQIRRQLTWDIQVMMYLVALQKVMKGGVLL